MFALNVNDPLGAIRGVRIGHDNSGKSPSWFLEEVLIRDTQTNQSWSFPASQWFALERGDGRMNECWG